MPLRDETSLKGLIFLKCLLVFLIPQVMVPCHHLPTTTRLLVQPVTLHLGMLGDPTVGHLATEHPPLRFLPPKRPQSPQLPLATAGTHAVPKDEIGVAGNHGGPIMDIPHFPHLHFFFFFLIKPV